MATAVISEATRTIVRKAFEGKSSIQEGLHVLLDQIMSFDALDREAIIWGVGEFLKDAELRDRYWVSSFRRLVREREQAAKLPGQPLAFEEPEPSEQPVSGEWLLNWLRDTFQRFLVLPSGAAEAMALWTVHTYAMDAADASPILALLSPVKRCGKTRTLSVLECLVYRPANWIAPTAATLYRAVEAKAPTLLLDEADQYFHGQSHSERAEEIRAILNASVYHNHALVPRCVGEHHEVRMFSTWCPKAISMIGTLPDTLADRSIIIRLRRRVRQETVERLRLPKEQRAQLVFRRRAVRWVQDHRERLQALRDGTIDLPDVLNDRAQDLWRPLIAIADVAGGHWPETARRVAIQLSAAATDEETLGEALLRDIRELFAREGVPAFSTATLLTKLQDLEERPWATYHRGRALTARDLARLLAQFGVHSHNVRFGEQVLKGYTRDDFTDVWCRYLDEERSGWLGPSEAADREKCAASAQNVSSKATPFFDNPGGGLAGNSDGSQLELPKATAPQMVPEWHDSDGDVTRSRCQLCGVETSGGAWCAACEGREG